MHRPFWFAIFGMTLAVAGAQAQTAQFETSPSTPPSTWPGQAQLAQDKEYGSSVVVISSAHPGKRLTCRKPVISENSIACQSRFGRAPKVYPRSQVFTLLRTVKHTKGDLLGSAALLGIDGGLGVGIDALVGVTLFAAVPVAVVVGPVFLIFTFWALRSETWPAEQWLYQQPGTKLTVNLRSYDD